MPSHDKNGRAYALLSQLKPGDIVEADDGFGCLEGGTPLTVRGDEHGLYVDCEEGRHYLEGQLDAVEDEPSDHCIGMYPPRETETA